MVSMTLSMNQSKNHSLLLTNNGDKGEIHLSKGNQNYNKFRLLMIKRILKWINRKVSCQSIESINAA